MQLTVNITNSAIADKILWFLNSFKDKGVEVTYINTPTIDLDDKYIEKHWKEILMGVKSDPDYYGSEQYKLDRGEYLMEKYQ